MNIECSICTNRSACFNELSLNELSNVADNKAQIQYKKGETIIKQGSAASHIYFIKSGLVKVHVKNHDKNLILEIDGEGSMLGITALNYTDRYNFSVTAINDVEACEIGIGTIKDIMKNNVGFSSVVIKDLNYMIDKLLKRVYCLSQKNIQARMAELLISFSDDVFKSKSFNFSLSRNELAELTNMATENVVRTLKDFDASGKIQLTGKKVEILDYEGLVELSK